MLFSEVNTDSALSSLYLDHTHTLALDRRKVDQKRTVGMISGSQSRRPRAFRSPFMRRLYARYHSLAPRGDLRAPAAKTVFKALQLLSGVERGSKKRGTVPKVRKWLGFVLTLI
jgi:hypothetical protein